MATYADPPSFTSLEELAEYIDQEIAIKRNDGYKTLCLFRNLIYLIEERDK